MRRSRVTEEEPTYPEFVKSSPTSNFLGGAHLRIEFLRSPPALRSSSSRVEKMVAKTSVSGKNSHL
jgi:hypothetical protein